MALKVAKKNKYIEKSHAAMIVDWSSIYSLLTDDSNLDNSDVSYSIPVRGLGNIAIDVPLHSSMDMKLLLRH